MSVATDLEVGAVFRVAPQPPAAHARPVAVAAVLMILLAAATIASVPVAPPAVTLLVAAAAFSVRPLLVLHHRHRARAGSAPELSGPVR